jgi:glycosyltransferase involved in cell wall biosynthesis
MRIAYISTLRSVPWGGSEELWFQSAKEAITQGHSVGVFVYDWPNEPTQLQELRRKGALIFKRPRQESLRSRLMHRITTKLKKAYPFFLNPYKSLNVFKPDRIVVTDGATWYAANDEWLRRVLYQYNGRYTIVCQGNSAYHMPNNRAEAVTLFKNAKSVVFVAEKNRQEAFHQLACSLSNTCVIQNPIKVTDFTALPFPDMNTGTLHIALAGRLCISDKGQDMIIAMMAEPYWKQSNVCIHIYGKGDDLPYLKQLIEYYKVAGKVIIEDYAPLEKIWETCHCLLMPSLIEGTPLTLLEAMVCGRVCIATKVGGNEEWITDEENGYLVDAPVLPLISARVRNVLENKSQWPAIAENAHRSALMKLDKNPGLTLLKQILA